MHILADSLDVVNRLNLVFKKDSINLSTIKPMVWSIITDLENVAAQRGQCKEEFMGEVTADSKWHGVKMSY